MKRPIYLWKHKEHKIVQLPDSEPHISPSISDSCAAFGLLMGDHVQGVCHDVFVKRITDRLTELGCEVDMLTLRTVYTMAYNSMIDNPPMDWESFHKGQY